MFTSTPRCHNRSAVHLLYVRSARGYGVLIQKLVTVCRSLRARQRTLTAGLMIAITCNPESLGVVPSQGTYKSRSRKERAGRRRLLTSVTNAVRASLIKHLRCAWDLLIRIGVVLIIYYLTASAHRRGIRSYGLGTLHTDTSPHPVE